jgi:hypothetical protein
MRLALLTTILATACSTSYFPKPAPGLKVTMSDGSPTFWIEGRMVQKGIFGTGLAEAIADVPEAREHALIWRSRNITGLTSQLAGLAMVIPGVAVIEPSAGMSPRNIVTVSLVSAGLAAVILGTAVALSGQSHLWDALNLYNDQAAEQRARANPGGLSWRR